MRRKPLGWCAIALLGLVAASFRSADAAALAEWTVVLYFDGDAPPDRPDLEAAVVARLNDVLAGPSHPDVHVLALVDRREGGDASTVRVRAAGAAGVQPVAWAGTKLLALRSGGVTGYAVEVVAESERNLGDPATLDWVLDVARLKLPARRYALALKSHGQPDDALCLDTDAAGVPDALTLEELRASLVRFSAKVGRPVDVLALDACSMATVDTLAALGPYVDTFVASADLLFARSLPYRTWVAALQSNACPVGSRAAEAAVAAYPDPHGGGNVPSGCETGHPYGCLAAVPTVAAARLRASFDLLGEAALAALAAGGATARERLAVARGRAFRMFDASEAHLDALSAAEAIEASTDDPVLRWAAAGAASVARTAATALRHGRDLEGTCGLAVSWPCGGATTRYLTNALWATRGWPRFVRAFLEAGPDCVDLPPVASDLATVAMLGTPAVVRTTHGAGLAGSAPFVARRDFFAHTGPELSTADALFRVPFAAPPLEDRALPQSPVCTNRWAYGRFVFVGEATTSGGPTSVECPIDQIQTVPAWTGLGPARCAAVTTVVHVTLPSGWEGPAVLRLAVRQRPALAPPLVVFVPPWTAEVVCAYTSSATVDALATQPTPYAEIVGGPDGGPPGGGPPDVIGGPSVAAPPAPDWRREIPRLVPLPVGTKLRNVRHVGPAGATQAVLGPAIRLTAGGGCVTWRRFPSGTVVTVGHTETVSTGTPRSSSTVVTVP